MKNSLMVIGLLAILLACGVQVQAQTPVYAATTLVNSATTYTNIAGATATNFNYVLDVRKQAKVTLQISQVFDGAGTANCIYYFQRSVDGITYDFASAAEQGSSVVTIAGTGNTPVVTTTNLDTGGCGYIRLAWITNASASTVNVTNLVIKYGVKIQAP
jgi:hypothetical protein